MDAKTAATLAGLRALKQRVLVKQDETIRAAAKRLKTPQTTLYRLARASHLYHPAAGRQGVRLPAAKRRAVDRDIARGKTVAWISAMREVGRGTVYRIRQARRKRLGEPRIVRPYRCPGVCGQVTTHDPCTICAALLYRDSQRGTATADATSASEDKPQLGRYTPAIGLGGSASGTKGRLAKP